MKSTFHLLEEKKKGEQSSLGKVKTTEKTSVPGA